MQPMNVIVVSKKHGQSKSFSLNSRVVVLLSLFVLALLAGAFRLGQNYSALDAYTLSSGENAPEPGSLESAMLSWGQQLQQYKQELSRIRMSSDEQVDALTLRIGELQARMMRLDALGKHITELAHLDKGEFDFDSLPAMGGPEAMQTEQSYPLGDIQSMTDVLETQLDNRLQQLELMGEILSNQSLETQTFIAGRPIRKGWLSSHYGYRSDPFTGKRAWHAGVDFAGKDNSDIVAVASGVVTWSSDRSGYGNLVEINHGAGYSTRYGHCKKLLVKVGDIVEKGQVIARMGSTGRSTGPHVHFEVLRNSKAINPEKYVYRASR